MTDHFMLSSLSWRRWPLIGAHLICLLAHWSI